MYPIVRLFQILPAVEDDSPAYAGPIGRLFPEEKAVRFKIIIHCDLVRPDRAKVEVDLRVID